MESTINHGKNESPLREQGARSKTGKNLQEQEGERMLVTIPENVNKFIHRCADIVAANAYENHSIDVWMYVKDNEISSPIEQLFYVALETVIHIIGMKEYADVDNGMYIHKGVCVRPQCKIGNYVADFLLFNAGDDKYSNIVVELDGHAFHDKDEKQRRYEKRRDRYMQEKGYKVFRYTGAEIVANPFDAAIECVCNLTSWDAEEIRDIMLNITPEAE